MNGLDITFFDSWYLVSLQFTGEGKGWWAVAVCDDDDSVGVEGHNPNDVLCRLAGAIAEKRDG